MSIHKRVAGVGSGLGVSWAARRGAAAGLVWRCRIWTNGANILGVGRLSAGQDIAQHVSAETREMPPVCGPGHPCVTCGMHFLEKIKTKPVPPFGEVLAWRLDRVGHEAFMGVSRGVTPGLWQGSAACTYNENSNAILESTSRRIR